jgi:hypothetical protein
MHRKELLEHMKIHFLLSLSLVQILFLAAVRAESAQDRATGGRTAAPTALVVPGPKVPLQAPSGSGIVSVSQSGDGWGPGNREGALFFFRIEQLGILVEEKRLENAPLAFTLAPGSYELRGYSRGCDGNCNRLGPKMVECNLTITVAAGQALYAERILQNSTCVFRFNPAPRP